MEFTTRFFKAPEQSFFLFGPRGTGKTLWTRREFPDALLVDFLDPEAHRAYAARPERLRELVQGEPRRDRVVIDEVQKVPEILSVVHGIIEERKDLRFVLTGSSARKVRRAGVDLLGGRALLETLHPFMAAELGAQFRLEEALRIGLVPLVMAASDPEKTLRSYAALYVREEVQMEGFVRRIGDFSRFLEAVSFSHGGVLNVSNVARECSIERKTVEGYIGILEDLLMAFRTPVFTRRARRATAAHPKLYLFDAGVFRSIRPSGPLDRPEEIEGAALEGLVAQHLRAWCAYRRARNDLYYWRTRAGNEVDFVVYGEDGLWAIEVKNGDRLHPQDMTSLKAFGKDYPEAALLLLYRGRERLRGDGVVCVPVGEFLRQLTPKDPIAP